MERAEAILSGSFRFNPTLVRLRQSFPRSLRKAVWWFQSHAGSIEASIRPQRIPVGSAFQSHAGSIEAIASIWQTVGQIVFQSHAGSIEDTSNEQRYSLIPRFNPTLVRLRFIHRDKPQVSKICFNPTLVRLRL